MTEETDNWLDDLHTQGKADYYASEMERAKERGIMQQELEELEEKEISEMVDNYCSIKDLKEKIKKSLHKTRIETINQFGYWLKADPLSVSDYLKSLDKKTK